VKSQINDIKTQNLVPKYTKIKIFRGPAGGAYSAPPDPIAGGARTPPPLSALRASSFGPSGLADSSPHFLNRGYAYDFKRHWKTNSITYSTHFVGQI